MVLDDDEVLSDEYVLDGVSDDDLDDLDIDSDFQATGKGDMYVNIPNRNHPNSRILLKDVLYAPSMGVTLVSISRIASAGSTVVFTGEFC